MYLRKGENVTLLSLRNFTVYITHDQVVYSNHERTSFRNRPGVYQTQRLILQKESFHLLDTLGLHVAPNQDYVEAFILVAKTYFGAKIVKDLRYTKINQKGTL